MLSKIDRGLGPGSLLLAVGPRRHAGGLLPCAAAVDGVSFGGNDSGRLPS
jgi:hypothetical protein